MTNLILCGGSGKRLWPLSMPSMPKQFLKLFNQKSLFQLTLSRNSEVCSNSLIVTAKQHYFTAMEQIEELGLSVESKFVLEPIERNTAASIAIACFSLDESEIVLVTPSDHLIKNKTEYKKLISNAIDIALDDHIVTFGITPDSPEVGFGYIKVIDGDVKSFHEKPDLETAIKYLSSGDYYWNSGIFMFKAGVFLDELKKYSNKIFELALMAFSNSIKNDIVKVKYQDMIKIPENSVDYAVIEKSNKVKMVPSDIGWSDLGSFDSLYDILPKDELGNTNNRNYIPIDSNNNLIYGSRRQIATVDLENYIVIDTEDAILVAKRGSSQKVKDVVEKIAKNSSCFQDIHSTTIRPWGYYTVLESSDGYKIKKIEVKPGKRLSLQKHYHRNEHWIVVSGTATVTIGNETKLLCQNESMYIKMGEIHRLSNEGRIPVVLIEAQVGEYTEEDDILRIDDDFERDCIE